MFFSVFDLNYYQNQYDLINFNQKISKSAAIVQVKDLYDYLNGAKDQVSFTYTNRELLHLSDIKNIIFYLKLTATISTILTIVLLLKIYQKTGIKSVLETLLWSNLFSLIIYFLLTIGFVTGFDQLFLLFHQIMFRNDYWLLDPETEILINLFPPQFFANLAIKILKTLIFVNIISIILLLPMQAKKIKQYFFSKI